MQSTYPHNPQREERKKQRKKREYGCYYAYYCDRYPACQGGPFPIIKVDHTGLSKTNQTANRNFSIGSTPFEILVSAASA